MKKRRLMKVQVSKWFWIDWMTQGFTNTGFVVNSGIPKGAEFVRAWHEDHTGHLFFVFHHESFAPVPLGAEIPLLEVTLHSLPAGRD